MNNFKKYLPSKNFASIILIIIVFITLFFAIKGGISLLKGRKNSNSNEPIKMTVGGLIQKDSNNNGIADWEEYLWGLDPNKNGNANKEFIVNKKKELQENGVISISDDSKSITENDMLSRQFFATIISLQQTGELNEETMNSVSESLGQNIVAVPIEDMYRSDMLTIQNDSSVANKAYYEAIGKLVNKYSDANIGSELTFIVQGLSDKDPQALYAAKTVADAYMSFGEEFLKIPVPRSLASIHLSTANNYEKTGQSIKGLSQTLSDPIVGMRAIVNYKKYSDLLASDLEKISNILQ
jgi:hypothetical protein